MSPMWRWKIGRLEFALRVRQFAYPKVYPLGQRGKPPQYAERYPLGRNCLRIRSSEFGVWSSELVFVIGRKIVKICRWQILGSKN
jgi:hypothetical protein